ncbi:neuronal acetylcholine receptor subunit beta-2-like [Pieris rapae]|uniref:neuronal acetylcholine receptor subunit beta-2-like n=1 Tax=Pieris rapae TaxID=64459 RepID=UPI001E281822|nr:neuronal acetylcholine receptor subunit beta-2-like [Pieris rapae]
MLLFTCLSLLLVVGGSTDTETKLSWEGKLDKYIKSVCPETRLMAPEQRTNVTVTFTLKSFSFDAGEEIFSIYSWILLKWKDRRIKWNPKDYGDIDKLPVSSSNIWNPMDNFQNSKSTYEFDYLWTKTCRVYFSGGIICMPRTMYEIICISKLSDWPYDTQTCRFEFKYRGNTQLPRAVFTFGEGRGMKMLGAEYGGTWNIVDYKQGDENEVLFFELTVERQAMGLGAMLTAPAITLMLLTISSMLLDIRGPTRLLLCCFSLLSHFIFLQLINYSMPKLNRETPSILIYIRTSLVITGFTLMLSFLLNHMSKSSKPPPTWISGINTWVQSTPLTYVIQSSLPAETVSENLTKIHYNEWMDFINLVNNLVTIILPILYLTFYIMYVPRPPSLV